MLSGLPGGIWAQTTLLQNAHKLYEQLAFYEAIPLYEAVLQKRDDPQAGIRLADCYRLTSNFFGAERWYGEVVASGMAGPDQYLYYAQALLRNGKPDQARPYFERYQALRPEDPRGANGVLSCDRWQEMAEGGMPCRVENLNINTARSEFGPVLLGRQLLFASDRDSSAAVERDHLWTGRDFLNIYRSSPGEGGGLRSPVLLEGQVNGPFHDGPLCLNGSQNRMYFTRNSTSAQRGGKRLRPSPEGQVKLSIHRASREAESLLWRLDEWDFPYNNDAYSSGHPAVSADDSTLVFASDRPGGLGGVDLYRCRLQPDGTWGLPENLGPGINTPGDEMFPVLHPAGDLLFASDGLPGLGGLDLFLARSESGSWAEPRNLGAPLNSYADDFSLILEASWQQGYFSSNRSGGRGGDDLYSLRLRDPQLLVRVRDAQSGEWLPGTQLSLRETETPWMLEKRSDAEGSARFEQPRGVRYRLQASLDSYEEQVLDLPPTDLLSPARGELILDLVPLRAFRLVAEVLDAESRDPLGEAEVLLRHNSSGELISVSPDSLGWYHADLEEESDYLLTANLDGYLGDEQVFSTKGLTEGQDLKQVLELHPLKGEVVIELSNIYYDLDRWYIRRDAVEDLDRLAKLMQRYPTMRIELASHTDSRGSDTYNQALSQKRAEAAVAYLVSRGVDRERMVAQGYGESRLRNRCSDAVYCPEREHQVNRRTEFRVLYFGRDLRSADKEDIPVNTYLPSNPEYLEYFLEQELRGMEPAGTRPAEPNPDPVRTLPDPLPQLAPGHPDMQTGTDKVWFQSGRTWSVHLGSGSLAAASRFDRYRDLGRIQFEAWQGGRYLFVLGYYTSKAEAEEVLRAVQRRGLSEAYLVQYKQGERQN